MNTASIILCYFFEAQSIKASLACVARVSVRFRSKERGRRVKDSAKNGVSKRAGSRPKPRILFLGLSFDRSETKGKRLLRRLKPVA